MTDRPTVTWVRAALFIAAGVLGVGMLVGTAQHGPIGLETVLQVLAGWSFVACGCFLWIVRPANRLGPLMVLTGMLWVLGRTMTLIPNPVVFTVGIWFTDLWTAAFALFLLSFPSGRLRSRADRAIVGIFLFVVVPLEFLWLLSWVPENGLNILAIAPDESTAKVVDTIQRALVSFGRAPDHRGPAALAAGQRPGSTPDGAGSCRCGRAAAATDGVAVRHGEHLARAVERPDQRPNNASPSPCCASAPGPNGTWRGRRSVVEMGPTRPGPSPGCTRQRPRRRQPPGGLLGRRRGSVRRCGRPAYGTPR